MNTLEINYTKSGARLYINGRKTKLSAGGGGYNKTYNIMERLAGILFPNKEYKESINALLDRLEKFDYIIPKKFRLKDGDLYLIDLEVWEWDLLFEKIIID